MNKTEFIVLLLLFGCWSNSTDLRALNGSSLLYDSALLVATMLACKFGRIITAKRKTTSRLRRPQTALTSSLIRQSSLSQVTLWFIDEFGWVGQVASRTLVLLASMVSGGVARATIGRMWVLIVAILTESTWAFHRVLTHITATLLPTLLLLLSLLQLLYLPH